MRDSGTEIAPLTGNMANDSNPCWLPPIEELVDQIVFASNRDGQFNDIYVINRSGTNLTRLTDNLAANIQPRWSPDAAQIAFTQRTPMSTAPAQLDETATAKWRNEVLILITRILASFILFPALIDCFVLLSNQQYGRLLFNLIVVAVVFGIAVPRRLPFALRLWGILAVIYFSSTFFILVSGLVGTGRIYLFELVVIAALLLNSRGAVATWLVSILTLGLIYAGFAFAHIPLPLAIVDRMFQPANLLLSWTGQAIASATVGAAVLLVVHHLQHNLQAATVTRQQLQCLNAELEQRISRRTAELQSQREFLREANQQLQQRNEQLQQRNQEMQLLNRMGDHLQRCPTIADAYAVIADSSAQMFAGWSGGLYLAGDSNGQPVAVVSWGDLPLEPELQSQHCQALQKPMMVHCSAIVPQCAALNDVRPGAALCVPLIAQEQMIGILHLRSNDPIDDQALQRRKQLADAVAHQIAWTLANLALREQLQHQALRDPLTGLYNRRYLNETLPREVQRAERLGLKLGVIMLDIDYFKCFNDSYGHIAGDALLKAVGAFLTRQTRSDDIVCRYGGEEFILVLPGASLDYTCRRAAALCKDIRTLAVESDGQVLKPVTISLGVAATGQFIQSPTQLIQAADQALYEAKRNGRNQVVVAQSNLQDQWQD